MNTDYIAYKMPEHEFDQLNNGAIYIELWQGLPKLPFTEECTRSGMIGARYMGKEGYVWVGPRAYAALKVEPKMLLVALSAKRRNGLLYAFDVEPAKHTIRGGLEDAIAEARKYNEKELQKSK